MYVMRHINSKQCVMNPKLRCDQYYMRRNQQCRPIYQISKFKVAKRGLASFTIIKPC